LPFEEKYNFKENFTLGVYTKNRWYKQHQFLFGIEGSNNYFFLNLIPPTDKKMFCPLYVFDVTLCSPLAVC